MLNNEFGPNVRGLVMPNIQVDTPNNAALAIYDQTKVDFPNKFLQYCQIQNISNTQKVYVCLNDDASAANFCKILAVDTGAAAGNGGIIQIPGSWNVTKVSVITPGGAGLIAVLLVLTCMPNRVVN